MIPFNRPVYRGNELRYLEQAASSGHTSGNGSFTRQAETLISDIHGGSSALLTTSCTHALELAARLLNLEPGDEVIVPAYTFVSTASAFVWNGARPVFADVLKDTMNIDPASVRALINERTRAICIVHYGGIAASPEVFAEICAENGLALIEDNAHGLGAKHNNKTLGTFGALSTLSFHETKNVSCGEGGALIVNEPALVERAEVLREKGTNRARFLRGQVDKYTWTDIGSSWILSDLLAAILVGQLETLPQITHDRMRVWTRYHDELKEWAKAMGVALPVTRRGVEHSGHMFFLRFQDLDIRTRFIEFMRKREIMTVFHYQNLQASPVGRAISPSNPECPIAEEASHTLVRLPLFRDLAEEEVAHVINSILEFDARP